MNALHAKLGKQARWTFLSLAWMLVWRFKALAYARAFALCYNVKKGGTMSDTLIESGNEQLLNNSADETALQLKSKTRVDRLNRTVTEKLQAKHGELDLSQMLGGNDSELTLSVLKDVANAGLDQEEKIFVMGLAAALHRPDEGYLSKPVKPSDMTEDGLKVWGFAINKLRDYQKVPKVSEAQYNQAANNITYEQRVSNANLATDILSRLSGNGSTEQEDIMDMFNDAEFQMLSFEVLPPGLKELAEAINSDPNNANFQPDRVEFMIDLAKQYPNSRKYKSKISLQNLENATTDQETGAKILSNYYILEFELVDSEASSTTVAFAENFMEGNAIFIVREDVHVAGTWREILSLPRTVAKELCTRIQHKGDWQAKAREALK